MSDNSTQQNTSTPSRPPNKHRQTRSSPQVPTTGTGKKNNNVNNNKGRRFNNPNNGQQYQHQQPPRQESALTKKFREAAQMDNGAASDSAINSVVERGIVTPPATPGSSNHRREPNAYVSDSAIGAHANGNGKKNFNNKKKGKGKRGTDIPNNVNVQHFTPPKQQYTPPDDLFFGKPAAAGRYAGAIFHDASPAPNALPLPKFFSKSVPTTTEGPSLSKMLAETDGRTQVITDSPPPTAPLRTPLDIFFQADKEEKARKALAAISQNEVVSPQPLANPANELHNIVRNITPPSAALPNGLGSPFGGKSVKRDDMENDRDMLFTMDFSDKKAAPRPVEEVVIGPRHRPLSAKACDPETHIKRTEKANQIKAALMGGGQSFDLSSPSPNPKLNAVEIPDTAGGVPLSPTIHERRTRTNNVGFAPAPRIRHFNQNRPVNSKANGQHHRNGRNQQQQQQQNFNHNVQNNFQQPNGHNAQTFDPVRARMAESHIRGVLKLDSPIPAI
ncbi:hypothetical protein AOL_s00076g290 [Orbilia oligospora ATCC 24927]|uniref:Uncharacterized protein n=1 Tax=Arthrobotrys oligospora (strain ATCC 24927 / CBS 115.81 / DSM 1491) TaxID=756982 RepID=G1X9I3_ARTOA|nr:hypothetical protein AOL_s00076g290 [Orbilia oligospora ATCC 24927]EGX50215.1 hypothetical protein AOL_s00076g290 [Orbilia oligospora ATCC 24927]